MAEIIQADKVIMNSPGSAPDNCLRRGDNASGILSFSGAGIFGAISAGSGAVLTGTQAVGLLPAATASVDGKMTAAMAALVLNGYQGAGTTTQRDALTSPLAGWQWYNTDLSRWETYSGAFWLGPQEIVLINRTTDTTEVGKSWIVSPSFDFSFANPGTDSNIRVAGVVKTGGVANGSSAVVSVDGVLAQVRMAAGDNTVRGNGLYALGDGTNESAGWIDDNTGCFGISLESKNDVAAPYLVWGLLGLFAEVY